ncbi:MAG: hypothetical protein Q4D80_01670 [Pseudomonadota bacterium]|nr:hypothetical protein [Pseudomonadota bacterium]
MSFPKFLADINRTIPLGQQRVFIERVNGRMFIKTNILAGDFLLADGSYSASSVFHQERGIFIGKDDKFIEISSISGEVFSREDARNWCEQNRIILPSKADLQAIDIKTAAAINNSLRCIGLGHLGLLNGAVTDFWSQESIADERCVVRRRIMVIKQAVHLNKPDFSKLDGLVGKMKVHVPDVFAVHRYEEDSRLYDEESFWVLQRVFGDCCQVLPVRLESRGSIYLECPYLVIENPVGGVYCDGGVNYVPTHKDYFQRHSFGLYVKVSEDNGRRPV